MTDDEKDAIEKQLEQAWPRSFSAELMATYSRRLGNLPFAAVSTAIADHQSDSKYRPFVKEIVRRVLGPSSGTNTPTAAPDTTGSVWADTLKAQWVAAGHREAAHYNAVECFCRYLRGWYGARVLQHQRTTERARSDHHDARHQPAATIAVANDQFKNETARLYRDGVATFTNDADLPLEQAEWLAGMVLGSRDDYDAAMGWARQHGSVAARNESGLPDQDLLI